MSQSKKKQTPQQKQKILSAQYRKEFFIKFKTIVDTVCGEDIYPLIPKASLDHLYICRSTSFKFVKDPECKISSTLYKQTTDVALSMLKTNSFTVKPSEIEVSVNDYFTIFISGLVLYYIVHDKEFPQSEKVCEALKFFVEHEELSSLAFSELYNSLFSFLWTINDISKNLYWFKHELKPPRVGLTNLSENLIMMYSITPETEIFDIDGIVRPAIRFGWTTPFSGLNLAYIEPASLPFQNLKFHNHLPVFIQAHALQRLAERIDCFFSGVLQFNLFASIQEAKIISYNNQLLMEFSIFGKKVGYLVAAIIDGRFLIRTFLLLTNSGTPEGNQLGLQTGLRKLDKTYLHLDRLSTFMRSDFNENEEAKQVFIDSGCQALLELYSESQNLFWDKEEFPEYNFSNFISYIKSHEKLASGMEEEKRSHRKRINIMRN